MGQRRDGAWDTLSTHTNLPDAQANLLAYTARGFYTSLRIDTVPSP